MTMFDWDKYAEQSLMIETARESLALAEWPIGQRTLPRYDYKELNELIVVFLGGKVPWGFKPQRKGAMHDARFMADAIYLLSMELFSKEFTMDPILANQVGSVVRDS